MHKIKLIKKNKGFVWKTHKKKKQISAGKITRACLITMPLAKSRRLKKFLKGMFGKRLKDKKLHFSFGKFWACQTQP
jgi:hypothetical protein